MTLRTEDLTFAKFSLAPVVTPRKDLMIYLLFPVHMVYLEVV